MRIGVLGGTFNPPHRGHEELGVLACRELRLDALLFAPNRIPPHKNLNEPGEESRLELCQLLCEEHENWLVLGWDWLSPAQTSYTVDELAEVRRRYPDDEIWFICGSDTAAVLPRWHNIDELPGLASLAVSPRPGHADHCLDEIRLALPDLEAVLLPSTTLETSSTEVRALLLAGAGATTVLPAKILERILRNYWYQ